MSRRLPIIVCVALFAATPAIGAPCHFDQTALSFQGAPVQQAKCLLRPVGKWGKLGAEGDLPATLGSIIGKVPQVRLDRLSAIARAAGLPSEVLSGAVSRAWDNRPGTSAARYFVIHDTSAPWLGDRPFPATINSDPTYASPDGFVGPNAVAHAFIGRTGAIRFGHDFSVPWRATKREKASGPASKGLFLHVENVQPRRRDPSGGPRNDAIAPTPGLSDAQYRSLALLYAIASVRAGNWLIPAFHAALDEGISDAHDDPQNFDLAAFDRALETLIENVGRDEEPN